MFFYLNFQLYFEQNAPKELSSFQLIKKPNENEYTKNLMSIFRIKSSKTDFDEYIIPVRSHTEMKSMFIDYHY